MAKDAPTVIDPITGLEISLTEIDVAALTPEQRRDIGDQRHAPAQHMARVDPKVRQTVKAKVGAYRPQC